jgi:hypothetical protein
MQIGKRISGWLSLAVFATVGGMVAGDPAFAKVDVDKFTIGGEARIRYELRNSANFGTGPLAANESAASSRVRVNVGYDLTPDVSFFAQLQDARIWGGECNASTTCTGSTGIGTVSSANQNTSGVDLHQGFILLKNLFAPGLSLKLGRQEIIFGDHRLFGNFGWSQIGNSFDAARVTHSSAFADIDLFWARIMDSEPGTSTGGLANGAGVIFPPAGGSKASTDQDIYGAYITLKPMANWTIEPYYFLLADGRTSAAAAGGTAITAPQASTQNRNSLGGRLNGKAGGLDLTAEMVWQFGAIAGTVNRVANNTDRDVHINAHAEAFKIGYTLEPVPMKPRIGFEFDYASGDNCVSKAGAAGCTPTGGGHFNTFDNLYPTNHFHYGYMDLMAWKNMVNYAFVADVKPDPTSKVQVNFIVHRLARTGDNWYRASQGIYAASLATNQAASLGQELDLHYWRTFKEKYKFEVGYGHFFAGEYLEKSKGSSTGPASTATFNNDKDQNWGYVMGSVLF